MINGKTFYQVLGVLPDAEDAVIKAAWRSLTLRYHPDKWSGDPAVAHERMSEINRAYAVLSKAPERAAYDAGLVETAGFSEDARAEVPDEAQAAFEAALDADWQYAIEFFPAIRHEFEHLAKISRELAYEYRHRLLDDKLFDRSAQVFESVRERYLRRYFGADPLIQKAAENLILYRRREAALELIRAVRIFGASVKPGDLLARILEKHGLAPSGERLIVEMARQVQAHPDADSCARLIKRLGYSVAHSSKLFSVSYTVSHAGRQLSFNGATAFVRWVSASVVPRVIAGDEASVVRDLEANASCPSCGSFIHVSDTYCRACEARFDDGSSLRPHVW
jgi:phosphoglycolate phosphatase-like HAD superfamily hydrolase